MVILIIRIAINLIVQRYDTQLTALYVGSDTNVFYKHKNIGEKRILSMLLKIILIPIILGSGIQSRVAIASDPVVATAPSQGVTLPALPDEVGPATIAAGTSVTLRIIDPVTSRTAKRGDYFNFELVNDLRSGGNIIVPAGTYGVGQVVHAAPKGFGGRAGELIVAARYLDTKNGRLLLRKTKFSAAGSDNVAAALTTSMVVPIVGIFITGTSVDLDAGSILVAEIATDFGSDVPVR